MQTTGAALLALGKVTDATDEEAELYRSVVRVVSTDNGTALEATDSKLAITVDLNVDSDLDCFIPRDIISRLKPADEVHIDKVRAGSYKLSGPFEVELERADGKGPTLAEPYPDVSGDVAGKKTDRSRAYAFSVEELAKMLQVAKALKLPWIELRPPTVKGGEVYLFGERRGVTLEGAIPQVDPLFAPAENEGGETPALPGMEGDGEGEGGAS